MPSQLFNTYTSNVTTASYTNTYNKIKALEDDPFNSIVFDRNRHSIWAQGEEYGYTGFKNLTVNSSYLTAPEFNHSNYINNREGYARRFIDGVKYDKDNDSITVSYTYAYESSLSIVHSTDNTGHTGTDVGDFVRGISVNGHKISYSVNTFNTTGHDAQTTEQNYVITYSYINSAGHLHYTYRNISVNKTTHPGTKANNADSGSTTINNNTTARVLTNISQSKDGQISYTYQDIYTNLKLQTGVDSTSNLPVLINLTQDAAGHITYTYRDVSVTTGIATTDITSGVLVKLTEDKSGKISYAYRDISLSAGNGGTQATATYIDNDTTFNVISSITQDKSGHISYTYTPVRTEIKFTTAGSSNGNTTITNSTSLNVITGFSQNNDGKITYTYNVLNTTHSGSASGDFLTSVSLSANGVLSGSAGSFSGNPYGDFLWDVSLGSDGTLSGSAGSISISGSGSGTADQKYVKNVTWNSTSHTLSFTISYFGGDSGETPITPSVSGTGGGQKFVNSIIFNGTKNHTVSISYCANPAVVCDNNTVKRVRASGATLTFYSS